MTRPWRLLCLWLVLVVLGTQHPFVLDWRPVTIPSDTFFAPRFKGLDPPFNVLMFIPLGALLSRLGLRVWSATLAGLVASASIELAQHYVAFRVPVLEDLAFNTLGALIGARYVDLTARWSSVLDARWARVTLLALVSAVVVWSAAPPIVDARLWRWQDEAVLVVGREQPGNYRFTGTIHAARLFVDAHAADALPATPDWDRERDGEGRHEELARRIEQRGGFTIDVDLDPAERREDVLERIFTYSFGVQRRNFMLASRRSDLVFRVRTRVTPIVGIFPDGEEPLVFAMPERRARVTVAYETGVVRAYVDGVLVETKTLSLPTHNGVRSFWLPRNALGIWLYMYSAGLVIAAGLAGLVRFRFAFGSALVAGVAIEAAQAVFFDRGIDGLALLPLLVGAAFGAWAAR